MLFDLRGRGRRRTVQAIYLGLAVLLGLGLVGFGVGGGFGGGGILNSLNSKEGQGSASFADQINKYEKQTEKQPNNVHAWEQLTLARLHEAGGEAYVSNTGLTGKGRELFNQIAQSWNSYVALNPPQPNAQIAQQMIRVFGEEGLEKPAEAVKVLQIVLAGKQGSTPQYQSTLYASLAEYAYKANNPSTGDLAAKKAVALAEPAQRKHLEAQLAELKKHPTGPEYTATGKNGEPIKVKKGPNGTFVGTTTAPKTAPPGELPTNTTPTSPTK